MVWLLYSPTGFEELVVEDCMLADPISTIGVKPSKARENKTGEFWFSECRDEVNSKAEEIAQKKGINYSVCPICSP